MHFELFASRILFVCEYLQSGSWANKLGTSCVISKLYNPQTTFYLHICLYLIFNIRQVI